MLQSSTNYQFLLHFIKTFNKTHQKRQMKRILAIMTINPDYIQFAVPQLKSILSQLPIPFETLFKDELTIQPKNSYEITHETLKNFPYVTLNVPDYEKYESFFQKACRETVMLHRFVLLISKGQNYTELMTNYDKQIIKNRCMNEQDRVACDFSSRNRILGRTYQLDKITNILTDFDIRGKIDISNAQKRYQLIEDHTWYQFHHESPLQSTLKNVYFGLELCNNKIGNVKFNTVYELKKRIYLGPTSADNDLAFMMCNQAKIGQGSFVIDPFVGTGGLIIPPASKGAYVFGCDLDMRVLNGYSVGRINKRSPFYTPEKKLEIFTPKIELSFEQYGFAYPNIFRMDSTNLAFKRQQLFDAIITDPPYGLRAMSRSIGNAKKQEQSKQEKQPQQNQTQNQQQITQTKQQGQKQEQSDEQQHEQSTKQQSPLNIQTQQIDQKALEEKQKKTMRRKIQKDNRRQRKADMSEEQKNFKKSIALKMAKERVQNWEKFDKGKVQCTQRQKIFQRLINFARTNLKPGGRLVMLYPIFEDQEYKRIDSIPSHEGFKVIDMSENKLAKNNSRILVTLEKQFDLKK